MLKVHTKKLGEVVVLRVQGYIVSGPELATLRSAVLSHTDANIVALDLSQTLVIDAGGLGVLLELRKWTEATGKEFKLFNPTFDVQQVLAIACLDSVFDIAFAEDVVSAAMRDGSHALAVAHLQPADCKPWTLAPYRAACSDNKLLGAKGCLAADNL
jgi:anti-anti-sigma factor